MAKFEAHYLELNNFNRTIFLSEIGGWKIVMGEIIAELRKDAGLTQRELADYLHTTRSTIGKYETGKSRPSLETLFKIADLFNVNLEYLLGRTRIRQSWKDIGTILNKYSVTSLEELLSGLLVLTPERQKAFKILYDAVRKEEQYEATLRNLKNPKHKKQITEPKD